MGKKKKRTDGTTSAKKTIDINIVTNGDMGVSSLCRR